MKKLYFVISVCVLIIVVLISIIFLLFPRKNQNLIRIYSEKYSLTEVMVASVINIESRYDKNSVSDAGAIGMMQLLPSTAMDCADRLDIEITEDDLYDEKINIELGCFYLSYLLNLFEGNITNSLCAYNWGLGNVKNWMELGNVDESGTIINVPVPETNNYLKKYKINSFVYENLYKYN